MDRCRRFGSGKSHAAHPNRRRQRGSGKECTEPQEGLTLGLPPPVLGGILAPQNQPHGLQLTTSEPTAAGHACASERTVSSANGSCLRKESCLWDEQRLLCHETRLCTLGVVE